MLPHIHQFRIADDCQAKLILTEEKLDILRMNPFTSSMWSITIPFVVTKPGGSFSKLLTFRGVKSTYTYDEDLDEMCLAPEGKSAILQFYLFAFQVLFSVASCGT